MTITSKHQESSNLSGDRLFRRITSCFMRISTAAKRLPSQKIFLVFFRAFLNGECKEACHHNLTENHDSTELIFGGYSYEAL